MVDELETEEALEGIFIVRRNLDQRELFTVVNRIFLHFRDWVMQMQISVLDNHGVQHLLDLSESIIGNHITVLDSSFKLLAYTQHVETDDENLLQLMEQGYHSEETVERMRLHRRIEQYETADENDIIINDDLAISGYVTAKRVYKSHGEMRNYHFASVVMVCCNRSCTDGTVELFSMLLDNIKYYIDRERPVTTGNAPMETFFCELISKTLTNEAEAQKRASYLRIPYEGFFELFVLHFDDVINTPTGRFIREMSLKLPNAKVILYGSDILILNLSKTQDNIENAETHREHLSNIVGDQSGSCGISNVFLSLSEISPAYDQAKAAAVTGERLRRTHSDASGISFFFFEDIFMYYLVNHCAETAYELFSNSLAFRAIKTLARHDNNHGTKLLKLLSVYLGCERNATSTCNLMHMHRNTVIYHIGKIESLLNVKLDDEDIRLKLILGLKAFDVGLL